jgi:DNA-binding PadR family transcriptional regulator
VRLLTRSEEFVLLAVWRLQDDAYTLPIREQLIRLTGQDWSLGSVYTPLERLARERLLTSYLTEATPERGGRPKRVYRLTPKGRQALIDIRTVEQAMWAGINDVALRGA